MSQSIVSAVERLLAKMPQWLRQDLGSNDASIRQRAEETLAAMVAAALAEPTILNVVANVEPDLQSPLAGSAQQGLVI